jgi:16S rRNA (uracil1498-N3)-methyltransferase
MRFHVAGPLQADSDYALPPGAARHAQVRRVQPGDSLWLFDGQGCDWPATVLRVGRSTVDVRVGQPQAVHLELPLAVTLAVGMPANERMDSLVEKATELGVSAVQPLLCERAVLRLEGERAERKCAHWQAVAAAACEQSGRACVPRVAPVQGLLAWLAHQASDSASAATRLVLSLRADAQPLADVRTNAAGPLLALSGPEGGLSPGEEDAARAAGFAPVSLGPRTLRADTAPLALLTWFSLARNRPAAG